MVRAIVFVLTGVTFLLAPAPAWSSEAAPRVAVIKGFAGPQAERIQGMVENGLAGRYDVVTDARVAAAARRQGVGLVTNDDYAKLGKMLDVSAFVSAYTEKQFRRGGWQVRLLVRRGDTGSPVGRILVTGRRLDRLERTLARQTTPRLQALVARAASEERLVIEASASESEGPMPGAAYDEPLVEEDTDNQPGELIELTVDGRVFTRSFSYVQNLSRLPEYRLGRAFASAMEVTFRPGVLISDKLAALGVVGGMEYGLGVTSLAAGDNRLSSDVRGYSAALEYRLGLGPLSVAPQVGYAASTFITGDPSGLAPNVRYRLLTAGAAGRVAVAPRLSLMARAAYLYGLSAGPLTAPGRFERATIGGVSAELAASFAITRAVELRATGGLRRYGFAMNSQLNDAWVAGGAIDQQMWGGLGLAYRP
jgi:hypothetical protein